ncbi:MAG: hypothetical protein QM649_16630, partial [Silvibacterium sp.]
VYTAGLATIPDPILCACAQIVKNAEAAAGGNVKQAKMDTMTIQYFSNSLIDANVEAMLAPWVSTRLG